MVLRIELLVDAAQVTQGILNATQGQGEELCDGLGVRLLSFQPLQCLSIFALLPAVLPMRLSRQVS